ncbi:MAG: Pvc16 family protein [Pseudomonadales bacterium]
MALETTSLSRVCKAFSEHLENQIVATNAENSENIKIVIGSPTDAEADHDPTNDNHLVNVFFYHFDDSGFDAQSNPNETTQIRVRCLISPFSNATDTPLVSPGENDLRLLGDIIRIFHENPVWFYESLDPEEKVHVEVVPCSLKIEEVSQIWSVQQSTSYRPSVCYELALVPVNPNQLQQQSPLASDLFLGDQGPSANVEKAEDNLEDDWQPNIAFVIDLHDGLGQQVLHTLTLETDVNNIVTAINGQNTLGNQSLSDFDPLIWVAGANLFTSSNLDVTININYLNSAFRWQTHENQLIASASSLEIDPEEVASAVSIPIDIPTETFVNGSQVLLTAERTYSRLSDGAQITVCSNVLLIDVV